MRRAAKVDSNHAAIVDALRHIGAWVVSTARLGNGFPDLLVCFRGEYTLLEVKDGSRAPSRRQLTSDEAIFARGCPGRLITVLSPEQAIEAITGRPVIPGKKGFGW